VSTSLRLLLLAIAVAVGGCHACDTVDEHLAGGRHYDACRRADTHPDEEPMLQTWLQKNTQVEASVVSHAVAGEMLGGPLRGYGDELALFDLHVEVPGGEATFADTMRSAAPVEVVRRLPPLQQLQNAPRLPALLPEELIPVRRPPPARGGGSGGIVGDIFDAVFAVGGAVGMAVGVAVGAAVAVPIAIMGGIASAIGGLFAGLFGGGGGGGAQVSLVDQVAPIQMLTPAVIPSIDGLLTGNDLLVAQGNLDVAFAAHVNAVVGERQRRLALLDEPGFGWGRCINEAACRVVAKAPDGFARVRVTFHKAKGDATAERRCDRELRLPLAPPVIDEAAKAPPHKTRAEADLEERLATANNVVNNLDGVLPHWALNRPTVSVRGVAAATAIAADDEVKDLVCSIKMKRGKPDAIARITVGFDRLRNRTVALGRVSQASLVLPGVRLKVGERVRLGVIDKDGDSLGGDVRAFDGILPVKLGNNAFSASCGAPNDDGARAIAKATAKAEAAVGAVAAAVAAQKSGAPAETDTARMARLRKFRLLEDAAETAISALAGEVGYQDPGVVSLIDRLLAPR